MQRLLAAALSALCLLATAASGQGSGQTAPFVVEASNTTFRDSLHMSAVQNSIYVLGERAGMAAPAIVAFNGLSSRMSSSRPTSDYTGVATTPSVFRITVTDPLAASPGAGPTATFAISLDGSTSSALSPTGAASAIAQAIMGLPSPPDPGSVMVLALPLAIGVSSWDVQYRHSTLGNLTYTAAKADPPLGSHTVSLQHLASAPPPAAAIPAQHAVQTDTPAVEAVPAVVNSTVPNSSPLTDPSAVTGPVLAAGIEWVAVGHPLASLNQSGVVSIRHRAADGTLGPAGVITARIPPHLVGRMQGILNITALVRGPNPWVYDLPADPGADLLPLDTAAEGAGSMAMPPVTPILGPRFGAAVAIDGPWLVVGAPWLPNGGVTPPSRPGAFCIFALSPTPGTRQPRAVLSLAAFLPDSMGFTGARSGPHPGALALTGTSDRTSECGSTVAIGGGFAAVGCPGLYLPATTWTPAVDRAGGVLILRKSRPNDTEAIAEGWPFSFSESAVFPMDLRSDASVTQRPVGQPMRAEAVAKSAVWVIAQILVPSEAESGLELGAGRGSASFLAVNSRHVAVATPGGESVFVWRRRNGRAPAFDPASQQTIKVRSGATGIALIGGRLVVSVAPGPATGPVAAELFEADALGFFHAEARPIGAGAAKDEPQFGVAATFAVPPGLPGCNTTGFGGPGASVAATVPIEGSDPALSRPSLRVLTTCAAPAGSHEPYPATVSFVDVGASCPSFLSKPASPGLAFFPSVASSRSIFTRSPGQPDDSPPGECAGAAPRAPGAASFVEPFLAANRTAPAAALGAGPAAACVLPCEYGHTLASGAQLTTCEAHGSWSILPDEVPNCEPLLVAAPPRRAPAHGREIEASVVAGSPGRVDVPGLPGADGGGDDPQASPVLALRLSHVPTLSGPLDPAALRDEHISPVSLLSSPLPAGPAERPAFTLRSVLGAFRAVDGTYAVARAGLPSFPILALQSRRDGLGPNGTLPVVPEASGGAVPPGAAATAGHFAAEARARTVASLAALGMSKLPAVPRRPAAVVRNVGNGTPVLAGVMEQVTAAILVRPAELQGLAQERFEPAFGSRYNRTRCLANPTEGCGPTRSDDGVLLRSSEDPLGPATDPLSRWEDPAGTLDPLRAPRFRRAPSLLLPARRPAAVRSVAEGAPGADTPAWMSTVTTAGDLGSAGLLALPGASSAPVLRFSPANASILGPSDPADSAGHLLLDDSDLLGTEALLAPMTWHSGFSDFDVAVQARGGPVLGGAPLSTTVPVRVCCATGRGREPLDERRRRRGPIVTSVRVHIADASTYSLSSPVSGGGSRSFLDVLLSRLSLRLGNVSAAASLAGLGSMVVPTPSGSAIAGVEGTPSAPGFAQLLGAGTAALDVPGASATLLSAPTDASALAPPDNSGATASRDPVTGRFAPWPSGASFDLRISGFGAPDASDVQGPCAGLEPPAQGPEPAPAGEAMPGAERTAHVRVLLGSSRTSSSTTVTLNDADRLAKVVLRAAGQPINWYERRRCVAADLRST